MKKPGRLPRAIFTHNAKCARLAERLSGLAAGDAVADIECGPGTAVHRAARLGASVVGMIPRG